MNPTTGFLIEKETVYRRLEDPLREFPDLVLLLPVLFAFVVLYFIMFFRQQESLGALLKRIFIPQFVTTLFTVVWGLYLMVWAIVLIVFAILGVSTPEVFEAALPLMLVAGIPILVWPLILGVLSTPILLIRRPIWILGFIFVGLVSGLYLVPAFFLKPVFSWLVVLLPVLAVAFLYSGLMYWQDAKSVNPAWAAFLAMLRIGVYCILGYVFLLPGLQTYNTRETHSKVLVLFDVSKSMNNNARLDVTLNPGQKPEDFTRQAKILAFHDKKYTLGKDTKKLSFLERVVLKSPVTAYRFGAVLDDYKVKQLIKDKYKWSRDDWQKWLDPQRDELEIPDEIDGKKLTDQEKQDLRLRLVNLYDNLTDGTNVSGAALQAALKESEHLIQSIVIFSDGQSNLGSADAIQELHARAKNPKRPIHIITVGVGKYRKEIGIRVGEVRAPQQARPDDDFKVQVPVFGNGLPDKTFRVYLDVTRVQKKGEQWIPIGKTQTYPKEGKEGKFKGAGGEFPYDTVEFSINVRKLAGLKPNDKSRDEELEGYYEFNVRVPALPGETSNEKIHTNKRPARVLIQKRKLRVLLFADGPSREYQFVRSVFFRESLEKRVELSIFLQQTAGTDNVDQDVPKEYFLSKFPTKRGTSKKYEHGESLSDFDVVIGFDPDWSALDKLQLEMFRDWVRSADTAGGFVMVAGPVNTYQLARGRVAGIDAIKTIVPVVLKDNRLHALYDSTTPRRLKFDEGAEQFGFLNIAESGDYRTGWREFFWEGEKEPVGKVAAPYLGFYNYYPVEREQPGSYVLARFDGPPESRIKDGTEQVPFFATMPAGGGKSVYVGSPEIWRLRMWDEEYHKRFWVKVARYAGGGNLTQLSGHGVILAPRKAPIGQVTIEALVKGADKLKLDVDQRPKVEVKPPAEFDETRDKTTQLKFKLQPRVKTEAEHQGWFHGKFKVQTPGTYTIKIPIPGTKEELSHDITIYKPDPETDNTRPDHEALFALATPAGLLLDRLDDDQKAAFRKLLDQPGLADKVGKNADPKERVRLYFPLSEAHRIPQLLRDVPPHTMSIKGAFDDLWDKGWEEPISLYHLILFLIISVGLLLAIILLTGRLWVAALIVIFLVLISTGGLIATDFMMGQNPEWSGWGTVSLTTDTTLFWILLIVPAIISLIVIAIFLTMQRWVGAIAMTLVMLLLAGTVLLLNTVPHEGIQNFLATQMPVQMSYVLAGVVGLLALEWLCRKLLRLA